MAAPAKGAEWYDYQKSIDEEIEAARGTLGSLVARLNILTTAAGLLKSSGVPAGSITEAQLDVYNDPADTKRLAWNTTAGKMEWVTKEAAANDTGEVRMNVGDQMGFIDGKITEEDLVNRGDKLCISQVVAFNIFAAQIM